MKGINLRLTNDNNIKKGNITHHWMSTNMPHKQKNNRNKNINPKAQNARSINSHY